MTGKDLQLGQDPFSEVFPHSFFIVYIISASFHLSRLNGMLRIIKAVVCYTLIKNRSSEYELYRVGFESSSFNTRELVGLVWV